MELNLYYHEKTILTNTCRDPELGAVVTVTGRYPSNDPLYTNTRPRQAGRLEIILDWVSRFYGSLFSYLQSYPQGLISLLLFIFAGTCKAFGDTILFHREPTDEWKNKYKDRDPSQGPAFFGSTTFLVFLTDRWHFIQMLQYTAMASAVVFYNPMIHCLVDIALLKLAHNIVFELVFRFLK